MCHPFQMMRCPVWHQHTCFPTCGGNRPSQNKPAACVSGQNVAEVHPPVGQCEPRGERRAAAQEEDDPTLWVSGQRRYSSNQVRNSQERIKSKPTILKNKNIK